MFRPHSTPAVPNRIAGVFSFGSPALSIWRSSGNKNDPRNKLWLPHWLEAACRPVFWGSRAKNLFPDKSFNTQKPLELQGPRTLIFRLFPDISLGGRLAVPPNGRFATRAVKSAVRMEVSPLSRLWLLDWRALSWIYPYNILAFIEATRRPLYTRDMKSTDPRVLAFIEHLREQCREGKTRIILKNLKSIRDWDGEFKDGLDGYFSPPGRKSKGVIIIAADRPLPTVLHTLAHEYIHYLQWKYKIKYYHTVSYRQLEEKTEARALKLLEQFNLPIDLSARVRSSKRYIKRLAKMR